MKKSQYLNACSHLSYFIFVMMLFLSCDFLPSGSDKIYTGREPFLRLDVKGKIGKSLYVNSLSERWTIHFTGDLFLLKTTGYIGSYGEILQIYVQNDTLLDSDDLGSKKEAIIKVLNPYFSISGTIDQGTNGLEIVLDHDDYAAQDFIAKRDSILPLFQKVNERDFNYALYLEGHKAIKKLLDDYMGQDGFYSALRLSFLQEALRCDCLSEQEALDYFNGYIDSSGRVEGRFSKFITMLNKQPLKGMGLVYKGDPFNDQNTEHKTFDSRKKIQIAIDFSNNHQNPITDELLKKLNFMNASYSEKLNLIGVKCVDCNEHKDGYSIKPRFPVIKNDDLFNDRLNYIYPEEKGPRVIILNMSNDVLMNTFADDLLSVKIDGILVYLENII